MSDECPPEITNPGVRKNWHLFDAESRAGFVQRTPRIAAVTVLRPGYASSARRPIQYGRIQRLSFRVQTISARWTRVSAEPVCIFSAHCAATAAVAFLLAAHSHACCATVASMPGTNTAQPQSTRHFSEPTRRQLPGTTQALPVPPSQGRDARGATARGRGRHRVSRRPRVPTPVPSDADEPPEDSDDDANDVYAPDPNAPKDDLDPLTIIFGHSVRANRDAVQSVVSASFRDVTGVPTTKHPWPKWTGEGDWTGPGMEINLEGTVTHRVNRALFRRVSEVAMQDLKKDKSTNQQWMNAPDVKLTLGLLIEIAKCTFRGFKRPYRAQHDADAKKRLDDNGRFSRWLSRRRQTCHNLMSAVPEYKEIHGVDPTPLLVSDLMSDEASGPEEGGETVLEWKRRMATLEGRVDVSDEFLTKKTYFEVITPNWRSDALTKIYHELARLWYNTLSVRFANAMVTRIRTSKRATNVPPAYTPYNFGINQEWYTENKSEPTYKILLRMWGQFPDPPGFGANTEPEAAPAETINAAASTSGSV